MDRRMRRALALLTAAALAGGPLLPEAARAAAPVEVSIAVEAPSGSVVAPAAGSAASLGGLSARTLLAPTAPLSAGASLSASAASAPAAAPAPAISAAGAPALPPAAVSAASGENAAPALAISAAAPAAAASDDASPRPASAAQPAAAPTPASAPRTLLSRALSLFAPRAPAAAVPGTGKADADRTFDGAGDAAPASDAPVFPSTHAERIGYGLGRWVNGRIARYKAKRAIDRDDFGGPLPAPKRPWGSVREGIRGGLNLIGAAALVDAVLRPLIAGVPWPLLLSPERMQSLGRVELLTQYGPKEIGAALVHSPLMFLGVTLPLTTAMEELTFRFMHFGLDFLILALAKPVAAGLAKLLGQIPDASGFRSKAQGLVLALGGLISYYAFPLAAARSALDFAAAHFAHWGVDPAVFAINLIAGIVLAKLAYKTRGLVAPFTTHMTFNLAMLGTGVLAVALGLPWAGALFAAAVSIAGVYSLLQARAAARGLAVFRGRRAGTKLLAALLIAAPLFVAAPSFRESVSRVAVQQTHVAAARAPDPNAPVVVPDPPAAAASAVAPAPAGAEAAADMIARVKPSVLKIVVKMSATMASIGSGVIVTPEGLAVTNGHVVGDHQPGDVVTVELSNGQQIPARIVAVNHDRDLAFLQLPKRVKAGTQDAVPWPTSTFAKTAPREGDEVFAMGHPLDLPFTVTRGIVSGRGKRGNMYVQYLQTDASINHGNSGGPLYNAQGEIVGINTMIMGADGSIGLGFSIMAPSVERALAQFHAVGNIDTAAFGVIVDLSNPVQPERGVAVEYVRPDSAADKAGILPGDVIVGLGGPALATEGGAPAARLIATILAQVKPGDKIKVDLLRDGEKVSVVVTLGAKRTTAETSGAHGFDGAALP
jgi:serine protease Do